MWYTHKYGILHSFKEDQIILRFVVKWMELEMILLREVSQIEIEKYHIFSLFCDY